MNKNIELKKISDVLDNAEAYIAEMRQAKDKETIPLDLAHYIWMYFRNTDLNKSTLEMLALFWADKTYQLAASAIKRVDAYTYAFFAGVAPKFWDLMQDRGVDTFYIIDNEIREDMFKFVCTLFELSGFRVVAPYFDEKADTSALKTREEMTVNIVMDPLGAGVYDFLNFEAVEAQIRAYMKPIQNIVYLEKDARVNYIEKVIQIGKQSDYLCLFKNEAANSDKVQIIKSSTVPGEKK